VKTEFKKSFAKDLRKKTPDRKLLSHIKDFAPSYPPDDDMMQCPWGIYAGFPWHNFKISEHEPASDRNIKKSKVKK